jgi:hypothetical protein
MNIDWVSGWADAVIFVFRYIVAGSAIAGLLIWVGKKVVENWLATKFKERLQNLMFEQSKETERLKGQINQEIEQLKGRINAQADRHLRLLGQLQISAIQFPFGPLAIASMRSIDVFTVQFRFATNCVRLVQHENVGHGRIGPLSAEAGIGRRAGPDRRPVDG